MVLYGVRLFINIFDLFIYRRFLETFIGRRRTSVEFSFFLLIACEIVGSAVNQLDISWLNFLTKAAILSVYISQYEVNLISKGMAVALYMGLVVVAEPVGYIVYKGVTGGKIADEVAGYYSVVFVMEILLLLVVEVFCKIKEGKNVRVSLLPREVTYTLVFVPFASIISCFLLIEISKEIISADTMVLCLCVIFSIVIMNYIVFLMIHQYTEMAERRHEEEMLYQETAYRDEYYQDVERYQEQIQNIKHDMKNQLAVLYDAVERDESRLVKDTLSDMLGDIRLAEDIIYSANPVLNSLLKVKVSKAREKGIEMTVKTFVPRKMSIKSGDIGVIYGNLIDNAIEACMKVTEKEKFIEIETKYQKEMLMIQICNSKNAEKNPNFETTKKNKRMHGRGIRSVRKVAEQYGGNLILEDNGETFKASLLLTNIACLE